MTRKKRSPQVIVINVFFHIKQEQKAAYLTAMDELVSQSNKEEGAIFYNLFSDPKDDTRYIIVENWASQAALSAHNETAHFKAFASQINAFLVEPFRLVVSTEQV